MIHLFLKIQQKKEKMDTETEGPTTIHVTKSPFSTPLKSTPSLL